ncbi:MAG: hypothetical protein AAGM22_28550 [Acidobacteriota bacterium]
MSATLHSFPPRRPEGSDPAPESGDLDRQIREALGRLPRERAGEDFTVQVLERAAGAGANGVRRLRSLAAAAVFFAVGAVGAHEWNAAQSREAAAVRMASLRAEYAVLQAELQSLQRAADPPSPVVYLGGEGDVEYVLDLSRLIPERSPAARVGRASARPSAAAMRPAAIRPASY